MKYRTHYLKTHPEPFSDVLAQRKKSEFRLNDRDFHEGDRLVLEEWNNETQSYTGRSTRVTVCHVLHGGKYGVPAGYVILSLDF